MRSLYIFGAIKYSNHLGNYINKTSLQWLIFQHGQFDIFTSEKPVKVNIIISAVSVLTCILISISMCFELSTCCCIHCYARINVFSTMTEESNNPTKKQYSCCSRTFLFINNFSHKLIEMRLSE